MQSLTAKNMSNETKPMTLEECLEEFNRDFVSSSNLGGFDFTQVCKTAPQIEDFIRQVYRSAILYAAGNARPGKWQEDASLTGESKLINDAEVFAHNDTIEEYESNLLRLAGEPDETL